MNINYSSSLGRIPATWLAIGLCFAVVTRAQDAPPPAAEAPAPEAQAAQDPVKPAEEPAAPEVSTLDLADAALRQGDYPQAITLYKDYLKENPDSVAALYGLARAQSFTGQRELAIRNYTRILELKPLHPDALLSRGRVLMWEGRRDEAERDLSAVVQRSPNYADAWSALGDLYYQSERYDQALDAYSRWVDLEPNNSDAYLGRSRVYFALGDQAQASADWKRARELGADIPEDPSPKKRPSTKPKTAKPSKEPKGSVETQPETEPSEIAKPDLDIDGEPKVPTTPEEQGAGGAGDTGYFHNKATFSISTTIFDDQSSDWIEISESYRRRFPWGSAAVEAIQARRFEVWDEAYALDVWFKPRKGVVLNGRVQYSPDAEIFPIVDAMGDVYLYPGGGWELLGGYRHMEFEDTDIDFYSVGLGKYIGNWYGRYRATFKEDGNVSHIVALRYYYGDINDWVEAYTTFSQSDEETFGGDNKTLSGFSFGVRLEHSFTDHFGIRVGASYGDDEDDATSYSVVFGVIFWW